MFSQPLFSQLPSMLEFSRRGPNAWYLPSHLQEERDKESLVPLCVEDAIGTLYVESEPDTQRGPRG